MPVYIPEHAKIYAEARKSASAILENQGERSRPFFLFLSRFLLLSRENGVGTPAVHGSHYFNGYTCRGYFGSAEHRAPTFEED